MANVHGVGTNFGDISEEVCPHSPTLRDPSSRGPAAGLPLDDDGLTRGRGRQRTEEVMFAKEKLPHQPAATGLPT